MYLPTYSGQKAQRDYGQPLQASELRGGQVDHFLAKVCQTKQGDIGDDQRYQKGV